MLCRASRRRASVHSISKSVLRASLQDNWHRALLESCEQRTLLAALTWSNGPSLPAAKDHLALVEDGYGGTYAFSGAMASYHQGPSALGVWNASVALNNVGPGLGASRSSAGVIAFGGRTGTGNNGLEDAIRVDLSLGDNQDTNQMNSPRYLAGAASFDGNVFAIGGRNGNTILSSIEWYDSSNDNWTPAASMPGARYGFEAVDDGNGYFYVAGGGSSSAAGSVSNTLYRYDAANNTWTTLATMPIAVREAGAALAYDASGNAFIYVVGGFNGTTNIASVQKYDVANDTWTIEPAESSLPVAIRGAAAHVDSDGRLEVIGGINSAGAVVTSVFVSQELSTPDIAPTFTSTPPAAVASAEAGHVWSYQLAATGNPLPAYSLVSGPSGMAVTPSGLLTWQPNVAQVGTQNVVVRAANAAGSIDQSFSIHTVLETVPPGIAGNVHVTSVSANSISLTWDAATDNNAVASYNIYKKYRYGWRGSRTGYTLVGSSTTTSGTVTGVAEYTTQTYVVRAVDASGNIGANSAAASGTTWSHPTLGLSGSASPSVHALHTLNFGLFSRANPAPTFELVSGPASMTVDPTTGSVRWTPGVLDIGTVNATFRATNVVGSTSFSTSVSVTPDVPMLSYQINPANPSSAYSLVAGSPLSIQVRDYSFTPSTYTLVSGPAGVNVDPVSGLVTWTPTIADAGSKTLTINATNAAGSANVSVPLYVYFAEAPQSVAASNVTDTSATISWQPPAGSPAVNGYTVSVSYRARAGRAYRTYTQTANVGAGVTSYQFTGLSIGKTYTPRVFAVDSAANKSLTATGPSFVSRTSSVAPPAQAPLQGLPLGPAHAVGSGPALVTSGITVNVSFDDPSSAWSSYYDELTGAIQSAAREWSRAFNTNASLELVVSFDSSIASTAARSVTTSYLETDATDPANPVEIYEQGAASEINTGIDPNGSAPDIELHIGVNPSANFLASSLWFDPNPLDRTTPVPAGKFDAVSVMTHELGHAIGFNGWVNPATGDLPANYASSFDQFAVQTDAGLVFDGEAATTMNNGNPALTLGDTYHLAVSGDLMSASGLSTGTRYGVSPLDIAVMKDLGMSMDAIAPVVLNCSFEFETSQQIVLGFNESVEGSLSLSDMTLVRISGGSVTTVSPSQMQLSFDRARNTAVVSFNSLLEDGRYGLLLSSAGVNDLAGNRMAFDEQITFDIFAGDATRDGVVNFEDLLILAQHYGQSGTFSQGDFNYDGNIDFDDLLALSQRYNQSLPSLIQATSGRTTRSRRIDEQVLS